MVQPKSIPQSQKLDPRLYCDYARLVQLQAQTNAFSLLPHLKTGSALSGRHGSLFRGRGLNFEELRYYQPGDDIRNLDWKVTLRTGRPHVRCYSEEKDRNVIICVDQRSAMFFASVEVMKSVVAAEIAAVCGWRALKDGDRVEFIIISDRALLYNKAQRSQNDLLMQLKHLSQANQRLTVDSIDSKNVSFDHWVALLKRMTIRQSTLIFISDWHDYKAHHLDYFKSLQRHNDLLAVMVSDPLEQALPQELATTNWVFGDGRYQLSLNSQAKVDTASSHLTQTIQLQRQSLTQLMVSKKLPHIELDTSGEHMTQFQKQVGGR